MKINDDGALTILTAPKRLIYLSGLEMSAFGLDTVNWKTTRQRRKTYVYV